MKWLGVSLLAITAPWLMTASADGQDKKFPSDADIAKLIVGKWEQRVEGKGTNGMTVWTVKKE